jgi:hypothetical protein
MTPMLTGRCHCGNVHFTLPQSSAGVLACHCDDCRKLRGNDNAFLAAPIADVALTGDLVWYRSSAASRRAFYSTCGARVLKEVTAAGRWPMAAGLIDGPAGKPITRNLWEQSKGDGSPLREVSA